MSKHVGKSTKKRIFYQGVNILSVSKRLGHSSLETTMSTYTK
uniref:Integrase n=1 Tax=Enterococcus phage Entfac.YE1 TaxID=2803888 RepID=A0A831ERG3_9CAUD|nr:hypothetical protein 19 [Enterococcus phage Entfac.YE1]